jgi:hypothetical protein
VTNKDPIASLAPFAITITLAGRDHTVPPHTALDWLKVLLQPIPDLLDVIPGFLAVEDQVVIEEMIAEGELTYAEVMEAAHDVLAVSTGRDWWFVIKLATFVRVAWDNVGGLVARNRLDAAQMSIGAWIDAVFHICCEIIASSGKEAKQHLVRFTSELEAPPPGEEVEFDEAAEAEAFERAVRMTQH